MTTLFNDYERKYKIQNALNYLSGDLLETANNKEYKETFRIECAEKITEVTKLIMFLENH
jgi:hypothetical protein